MTRKKRPSEQVIRLSLRVAAAEKEIVALLQQRAKLERAAAEVAKARMAAADETHAMRRQHERDMERQDAIGRLNRDLGVVLMAKDARIVELLKKLATAEDSQAALAARDERIAALEMDLRAARFARKVDDIATAQRIAGASEVADDMRVAAVAAATASAHRAMSSDLRTRWLCRVIGDAHDLLERCRSALVPLHADPSATIFHEIDRMVVRITRAAASRAEMEDDGRIDF